VGEKLAILIVNRNPSLLVVLKNFSTAMSEWAQTAAHVNLLVGKNRQYGRPGSIGWLIHMCLISNKTTPQ
jgi:hypothetical protein